MIQLIPQEKNQRVLVLAGDKPFAEFWYPDSLEKPVLFSIYAPNQQLVTRGFPLAPIKGESMDHPHHTGLWFNYEIVNGLDFWNNSYAIPAEKKKNYGWIKFDKFIQMEVGAEGSLSYLAYWRDQMGNSLLQENTTYQFSADKETRYIDRTTDLTALVPVSFPDAKDGLLGLRLAKELELPSAQPKQYADNKGNTTNVLANESAGGNYLTSEGKQGDSAWGTRGRWCMIYGKKAQDTVSVVIIDHPANPGYPTYWHARGYGLFAANPLGEKIFSKGKETLNFALKIGEKVTFRYRIVIASGLYRLNNEVINQMSDAFAQKN